jgi:DNA-binding GntR family transcriptional regulator
MLEDRQSEFASQLGQLSIKSMGQEYGVSHVSTERALGVLKDEGLIYSVIGKGFFVTGR